jgi:hypothetical protein
MYRAKKINLDDWSFQALSFWSNLSIKIGGMDLCCTLQGAYVAAGMVHRFSSWSQYGF